MYHCVECGEIFDEPVEWEERHGLDRFEGPGERFSGCPVCLGDYEEVFAVGDCVNDEC